MNIHPKYPRWVPAQLRKGWSLSRKINKTVSERLTLEDIEKLNSVEGHTTRRQCALLFYFAYTHTGPGQIVEIGSFKGKSTIWIAKALQMSNQTNKVVAVDPHINTGNVKVVPQYEEKSSYDAFLSNLSKFGLNDWVEPVKKTSQDAVKSWNQPIKMLFVDGSHVYEDVLMDLRVWEPWVSIGGIICMHDTKPTGPRVEVRRVMDEYIVKSGRFKELLQLKNMAAFEKISSS